MRFYCDDDTSAFRGSLKVRSDYPTLRKEREGWGTRRSVDGIEPETKVDLQRKQLLF
jgi:hypothetical protein